MRLNIMNENSTASEDDLIQLQRIHEGGRHAVMSANVDRWRAMGWLEPAPSWKLTTSGMDLVYSGGWGVPGEARSGLNPPIVAGLPVSLEALADRIVARMQDAELFPTSPERSRAILVEELGKLAATSRPYRMKPEHGDSATLAACAAVGLTEEQVIWALARENERLTRDLLLAREASAVAMVVVTEPSLRCSCGSGTFGAIACPEHGDATPGGGR